MIYMNLYDTTGSEITKSAVEMATVYMSDAYDKLISVKDCILRYGPEQHDTVVSLKEIFDMCTMEDNRLDWSWDLESVDDPVLYTNEGV